MGSVTGCTCRDAVLCPVCRSLAARARTAFTAPEPQPRREALSSPQETRVPQDSPTITSEPEGAFLGRLRRLALDNGWLFHHVLDSRGCDPGFPDVCAVKPGHPLLLLELKAERGKLTREQTVWLEFLAQTQGVHVGCYRPSQYAILHELITRSTP